MKEEQEIRPLLSPIIIGSSALANEHLPAGCWIQRVGGTDLSLINCNGDDLEGTSGGAPFEQGGRG